MTPFILSPWTDLLILKGQTGPIHNAMLECWGLSFHCNEKAIYWDDSCRGSICFPGCEVSAITLRNSPCIPSPQTHFPSPWHVPNLERSSSWSGSTQYSLEADVELREMKLWRQKFHKWMHKPVSSIVFARLSLQSASIESSTAALHSRYVSTLRNALQENISTIHQVQETYNL